MELLEFYEQQSKALDFSRDSHKGNPVGYDRPPKGSPKGGKDRTPKGEGKGKEIRCRRCGKPGHVEKDCWSKSPKRTDKDKGKGKGSEKGGKPKGGKDRSHSPYDPKKKGNPKGGKPKGGKGEPKGGKGPKGGKPKGARASVGEEDEEDILGMGCALDMTVPPDILLNQLHSYGNRLTTSSVADTDATDPHFLVDSGASIHLISQSLVDEGYLQICREWAVNERCTTANGQEMILNRCVEAEFSMHALKSRHVSFLDCDGAAASSPCAASPVAASSRAAAPSPAAPASSSLSPVSRSICAGSQLQRPQKLRVTGLIGYGQVSLLSVALLASKGWTFSCSPGKSCSRTSREVDKPAKPPCLSLSHFGGHDQVPNRTRSSRTHLDIFLWCNVPWISIVHPGVIDIDMSPSLHSLHYTSDVEPSSHRVVRYSTMHEAVQDSVLHVAEREDQVRCTSALTVRTPSSPGFVEWSMPSDAWVDTTELSGEKKKEQSPNTVMEEPTEPAPGTVIAQAGQPDVEKDPSEPREETRRVVLVTMEPEESTEVIVKPPEQEPERSTEATVKPTEPVKKEKGLEMEKRESEVPKDLPEPEIPEKPFVETEKAQEATSEQEVTFRMKAWSNWLHRQDQKDEEKRIRNRARQRALRQQRRSDRAAGLQQAVRKGPSLRRSWTVTVDDPLPKGSVQKVLKQHTKAPRRERIVKLRLIEREVQASRVTAKGEYMIQNKHRAWIAPKARPQPKSSGSRVRKEFIEVKPQKGVTMVSLTGSEASDVGDLEEIHGALPESAPTPTKGPKSISSGLTGHERITSETIVRISADAQGQVSARRQDIKPGTAYFMKRKPEEPGNVKYTSQVRALWRPSSNAALSVTDASISGSEAADPPVLTLTEENLRRHETARRTPRQAPSLLPIKAKARPVGPQPPPGPPLGWNPVGDLTGETASPAGANPKEPASPVSVDPEKIVAEIAKMEIPEPKTPSVPGPKTPPTPTTRPKAKSRPLTEEQKAVADEVLAQKARDLLKAADLKRGTGTLEEEKPSTASGSGAKRVPKYLAHLTDEEREKLFRSELASERQAGAIEWEKELTRQEKEEEERRKAKALYRSERMAQALEHGKEVQRRRQEEFEKGKQDLLQWRAEEEDRENLRKARRISLEQPAVPPTAGGVVLTPAPKAISEPTVMVGESPATPPEALQAPLSEEEIAYRKQLQEHLSKFSDKREDAK